MQAELAGRPQLIKGNSQILFGGMGRLTENSVANIKNKSHSVTAEVEVPESTEPKGCICGQILRGLKTPVDCSLFGKKCTPTDPVGACMVSGEGTCATYYKYRV